MARGIDGFGVTPPGAQPPARPSATPYGYCGAPDGRGRTSGGAFRNFEEEMRAKNGPASPPQSVVPDPRQQPTYNFKGSAATPGYMEQFYEQNKDAFSQPSALQGFWQDYFGPSGRGQQHWEGLAGGYESAKNLGNNAQDAYNSFKASVPADTSPYYDYAADRATKEINAAAAGRGMLNSSGSLQQIVDAQSQLRGQQAQADAAYGLQRAGLMGNMGAAADNSGRANNQAIMSWLQGMGDFTGQNAQIANQIDQQRLNQVMGMAGVAGNAQDAFRTRYMDHINNLMGYAGATGGVIGAGYSGMADAEKEAWMQAQEAALAKAGGKAADIINNRASTEAGITNLASIWSAGMGSRNSNQGGGTPTNTYDPKNGSTMLF